MSDGMGIRLYGVTFEVSGGRSCLTYAAHPECYHRVRMSLPPSVQVRLIGPTETDGDKICAVTSCGLPLRDEVLS